jgi:predicted RNA binding protein YcfA (HicA-like mRNA interferase family)
MTRRELDRRLHKAGWTIKHGANHDLAVSPEGKKIALPRHRGDIPSGTADNILKAAGLK